MSKEAMKRTVDKIKSTFWEGYLPEPVKCKYPKCSYPCSDLPDCRDAQQALDKKAENARELGLMPYNGGDYEPAQQKPVAWMHTMDNTEGHKANKPYVLFTKSKRNPFGVAGRDYSKSYPVTKQPLYTTPPPCPTCEALARTVMMDQTGKDV
jgi:hypothetical protein